MEESNKIKETIEAATALAEAVPIYQDLLKPATQELGKGLHTISKLIHVALAPVSTIVWGYEKIADYLQTTLEEKLKNEPLENIVTPDISIAGPIIESMRFTGDKEELRDMFANLLASAMNSKLADEVHPAYVEIIKQLTSDEAKILKFIKSEFFPLLSVAYKGETGNALMPIFKDFSDIGEKSGCEFPIKISAYLDNLKRLGLIEFHNNTKLNDAEKYNNLKKNEIIMHHYKIAEIFGQPVYIESCAQVTVFGKLFYSTCVKE